MVYMSPRPVLCVCRSCARVWNVRELKPLRVTPERPRAGFSLPLGHCLDCDAVAEIIRSFGLDDFAKL